LKVTFQDGEFRAFTDYSERGVIKGKGWQWGMFRSDGGELGKFWFTKNAEIAALFVAWADESCREQLDVVSKEQEANREMSRATDANIDVPAPPGLAYLPYQKAGIQFAAIHPRMLLADAMGLGKTIQVLGVVNYLKDIKQVLIVCPASLRLNWYRESAKWLTRDFGIGIAQGNDFPFLCNFIIVNFDILSRHGDFLRDREWDLLAIDESHFLKNPKAKRTQQVFGNKKERLDPIPAKRVMLLTGTPILNRPKEIWPLIHYLDPVNWNNWWYFAKRYCGAVQGRWGIDYDGATNLGELQDKLRRGVMVRRLKEDVLKELPAKRRQVIAFPADTPALQKLINAERTGIEKSAEKLENLKVAVEMSKASDNPRDYAAAVEALQVGIGAAFSEIAKLRHDTVIAKLPMITEHVRETLDNGEKLVLFFHHRDCQDEMMKKFGAEAVMHRGGMSDEDKQTAVDRFQNDPSVKLFVGSIKASGLGITLTAASHAAFGELDWTPAWVSQCEDRIHRIGQKDSVLIQHLVLDGSLDAAIAQRLVAKQAIIDLAMDDKDAQQDSIAINEPIAPPPHKEKIEPVSTTAKELDEESKMLTFEQVKEAHQGVRLLAGMCDGAALRDDTGFNKFDAKLGHELAKLSSLTIRQAALARKVLYKYRKQLERNGLILT
jgi:SWI/SNF-related matrix-associated actin-dependent regulator of chromatin subfamily A-like protein 1